jgi:small subunit ribosomal protein S20
LANIKSQIKRNRQNDKRRLRNRVTRGEARTAVKNTRLAIEAQDGEASKKALLLAIRSLDRAAEKGVIHKNNAARRKSRLIKAYAGMQPLPAMAEESQVAPVTQEVEAKPKRRAAPRRRPVKVETPSESEAKSDTQAEAVVAEKKTPTRRTAARRTSPEKDV